MTITAPDGSSDLQKVTLRTIQGFKERGEKFAMLTVYDALSARMLEEAGIPLLLVGDTLGEVMLGYPSTVPVTMEEMLHHCKAVTRSTSNSFVVGDLPFMSYQISVDEGLLNAGRLLQEGGVHCVKLEGATETILELVSHATQAGIPVMGHLGLTPQSVNQLGGNRVQGRGDEAAEKLIRDALNLENAGASSLVLEAIPAVLGADVTRRLRIPTIGIGAGPECDGQVLVFHDIFGITPGRVAKFVKQYADVGAQIREGARRFQQEVRDGTFPTADHSYF